MDSIQAASWNAARRTVQHIRGGFGDDGIDSGNKSHDSELDDVAIAGVAAEYAAEQNVVD